MELRLNEMTFLCGILETHKLVGFEISTNLSKEESDLAIYTLKEKGLLKGGALSELGLKTLEVLTLYIRSLVFYKFGDNTIFANYQDNEYVMLQQTENGFNVDLITQDAITTIILSKFTNWKDISEGDYHKKFLSKEKFKVIMDENENVEAIFYYRIDLKKQQERKAVLYLMEGYLQHYNVITGELDMYPKAMVQKGIELIFHGEVN